MTQPGELSAALAFGWSLLLKLGLTSAAVLLAVLLGSGNLTLVVAGPLTLLLVVPAAGLLARLYGGREPQRAFALGRAPTPQLLLGASLGVLLQLPAGYVSALIERRFPTPPEQLQAQLQQLLPSSSWMAVAMLLSAAVLVPFAEELFFRGALFTPLLRSGPESVAVLVTSLGFVMAHAEPRNWLPLLLVALTLGELRRRSGSIWPGVCLHAAFNAATLLFVFVTRPREVKATEASWQIALGGAVLCAIGVWLFGRVSARRLVEVG
ncbi:MAG TPA: type II CAAX endopeptidase family protein [Polyangiaceae bacterium]